MSLDTQTIRNYATDLSGSFIGDDLNNLIASQGQLNVFQKKVSDLQSGATTLNKEFLERHDKMTPFALSKFATNQDLILLAFFSSYAFLTFVVMIVIFKNTGSVRNSIYALFLSIVLLLIISSILLRAA